MEKLDEQRHCNSRKQKYPNKGKYTVRKWQENVAGVKSVRNKRSKVICETSAASFLSTRFASNFAGLNWHCPLHILPTNQLTLVLFFFFFTFFTSISISSLGFGLGFGLVSFFLTTFPQRSSPPYSQIAFPWQQSSPPYILTVSLAFSTSINRSLFIPRDGDGYCWLLTAVVLLAINVKSSNLFIQPRTQLDWVSEKK